MVSGDPCERVVPLPKASQIEKHWGRVSCCLGWPLTYYVGKDDLELLILLLPPLSRTEFIGDTSTPSMAPSVYKAIDPVKLTLSRKLRLLRSANTQGHSGSMLQKL